MLFFSWPSEGGDEASSQPKRAGISTSKDNDAMKTVKAIILNFSGNVPVLYIRCRKGLTQFDSLQRTSKSLKIYTLHISTRESQKLSQL